MSKMALLERFGPGLPCIFHDYTDWAMSVARSYQAPAGLRHEPVRGSPSISFLRWRVDGLKLGVMHTIPCGFRHGIER